MTNEERIKRMSREELARMICSFYDSCVLECPYSEDCDMEHNGAYVWLGKESED